MTYDRKITITVGSSRKATSWQPQIMLLSELYARLKTPARSRETMAEYLNLTKGQQDDLKDVGGFVGGTLSGTRRKAGAVTGRDILTLDLDNIPAGGTEDVLRRVEGLGCGYCVYSTRKHMASAPRLRVILPLDRTASADEYEPCARRMAEFIGMTLADQTTFEASRLMYWPSCCADGETVYYTADKPMLSVDGLLATYDDWQDVTSWPALPGAQSPARLAAKQGDPLTKTGVVGAFCKVYDIEAAMETFLPGIYDPVDSSPGRFTFTGGSTTGGAVLYDDGKFLYSHHATDPCGGKLVNAFDLVRLHRFGDLDDEAAAGTPTNRLPSYTAMSELAKKDAAVSQFLAREAFQDAAGDIVAAADEDAAQKLGGCSGEMLSAEILKLALKAFGIQARRNLITGTAEITGLPPQYSAEEAINTLPVFLMDKLRAMKIKGANTSTIVSYLAGILDENRYNPVMEMLDGIPWDGATRFPELLRILAVTPDTLQAVLVRKWLIQSVAMAHNGVGNPVAAEGVLTLQGGQGIGKTHFFRRLAVCPEWFAEGVSLDMKNKDDLIRATGAWITELGELDSTLKREQSSLKAFVTSPTDKIRAPYAREATTRPRRASFCATVNPGAFLRDDTGDRRFWVIPVDGIALNTLVELSNDWFVQLWSEAVSWWRADPQGFRLTSEERAQLEQSNREFRELLPGEEGLKQCFNFDLPKDQWGEFTSTDIKRLGICGDGIATNQIGRALSKIAREDKQITTRMIKGFRKYRLPILHPFSPQAAD